LYLLKGIVCLMRPCKLPRGSFSLLVAIALSSGLSSSAQEAQVVAPVASRIVNRIDESHLVTLKGSIHPLANARNDRGAAPESMQLARMHLVLKRSDSQETALRQLINDMHTSGAASYHKWLTPDQFGKQFGPSDQDITSVETWLTQQGFSVTKVNPGKQTIEFSGNVAQMRSAFHTQIHKYEVNGETHFANAGDPQIPAALAPVVGGFVSLNNFHARSYAKSPGKATYDPKTDKAQPQWTIGDGGSGNHYVLSPADYAVQYDLNPLYTAGTTGAGQTIAVVNETNVNIALVNQFRSLFSLPYNPPQVIIDGNDPGIDGINNPDGPNGASIEAYLDVEWAGAVAPAATVDLVIAADTELQSGLFLAAEHAVYGNVAPIISLSFGACESSIGTSTNAFLNNLWEQAAAQGITVLVSTGDNGSAGCDNDNTQEYATQGQAVSGFASTPYNVAVGGTDFYYSGFSSGISGINAQLPTYWNETASNSAPAVSIKGVIPEQPWNASQYGLTISTLLAGSSPTSTSIAGGSGGKSSLYAKPAWQKGAGVPADNARDIPDVSLFASSGANASFYPECFEDGDCQPATSGSVQITGVGGTSASTPAFAGIMALVNQKYGRQGQADFVLYPLATQFPAAFHDVTAGTNSVPCAISSVDCIAVTNPVTVTDPNLGTATEGQIGTGSTAEYKAATGYDLASGLGTVDANVLVNDWNKVTFTSTTTTLTPSKTTFAHGSSITVSGSVTATSGTPTGDVALVASTTEPVQQQTTFALSSGSYSGANTTLPGGTYNIWGQYSGDGTNAASTSAATQVTVTPEASGVFFNIFNNAVGTTLTSGENNIPYGSQFVLSALTTPSSQLSAFENCKNNNTTCPVFTTPTGTVAFSDGSTIVNTAVVNAEGEAEYTPPAAFNVGSHSITASYSGDQSYNPSAASPITFTIVANTPAVLLTSPQASYSKGQTSTLTILVESYVNGTAPAGTVVISGAPSGTPTTATLSAGVDPIYGLTVGLATVTIPATAGTGTYNITAKYTPSGASATNYTSATSSALQLQITSAAGVATTTTGTASASATSPTASVVVTGTVTAASGSAPTGTLFILLSGLDSSTQGSSATELELGQVNLTPGTGSSSTFGFTVSSQILLQGSNQLTLQYSGSTTDAPSTALVTIANPLSDFSLVPNTTLVPINVSSGAATGTVPITLTSNNGFTGTVTLTCTASGVTCSIPGSESLNSGSSTSATLTISAPAATANLSYNVLVTGTDSTGKFVHTVGVQAVVSGSAVGSSSFSLTPNPATLNLTAGATTGNTSTITVAPEGTFTATVNVACSVASPSGATSPATCALAAPSVASATGTDVLTVTTTATTTAGAYTVTVTGNTTTPAITQTATVTVNVTAAAAGSFTLMNSGAITVAPGATTGNTSTITIVPSNGFTGMVNLSCSIAPTAASDPATCSIPASVSVTGGNTTATLSVSTTAASAALSKPKDLFWPTAGGAVLALVVFFGIPARKRNWPALLGLFVLFVSVGAIGCGGGSGGSGGGGGGGGGSTGTTAGTYTITVTGTSGTITQTTTVTLTVN
jgi:trimeric autotransporter adhesin